jgi:hypothetical protein
MINEELINQTLREQLQKTAAISDKVPNVVSDSKFLDCCAKLHQKEPVASAKSVFNLYTNGILSLSLGQYHNQALDCFSLDIERGVMLAGAEVSYNSNGIRCYFEIDYRSFVRFPTSEEMTQHAIIAFKLMKERFPLANHTCYVGKCDPKVKLAKKKKEEEEDEKPVPPKLAMGVHIVFPHIVSKTPEIKQCVYDLDLKITAEDPFFAHSVDNQSVHREDATLRPLFTYRLDECGGCLPQRKKNDKKTKPLLDMYDSDQELEDPLKEGILCESKECFHGYKYASHSIYRPWFCLQEVADSDEPTIISYKESREEQRAWIKNMSIIPPPDSPLSTFHGQLQEETETVAGAKLLKQPKEAVFPG